MIIARTQHHVMSSRDFLLQCDISSLSPLRQIQSNPFNDNSFITLHRNRQLNIINGIDRIEIEIEIFISIFVVQVCQVEDSGTESDDETDKEEGEEDEEGDLSKLVQCYLTSSVPRSLCLDRSYDKLSNK